MKNLKSPPLNCLLPALLWTSLIALIDILFFFNSPRNLLLNTFLQATERVLLFASNFILTFPLIFILCVLLRFRATLGKIFCGLLMMLYFINWGVYVIVGDFLGLEGLRFAIFNIEHIIWHMNQISPWYISILGLIFVTPFIIYIFAPKDFIKFPVLSSQPWDHLTALSKAFTLFLFLIAGLLIILFNQLPPNLQLHLPYRVSPQLSLLLNRPQPDPVVQFEPGMKKLNVTWDQQENWDQYLAQNSGTPPVTPVILIVVESMRNDVIKDPAIMPNLYWLAQQSLTFNAYAPSNISDYSWPAIFTSQYPRYSEYRYYHPSRASYPRIAIYDILKRFGYQTALFSAQNEQWCGMINFFKSGSLDMIYSADMADTRNNYVSKEDRGFSAFAKKFKLSGKIDDALVADKAIEWLSLSKARPFFIGINFQRPHFPYTWPETFSPPLTYGPPQAWFYPRNQLNNMRNRYFNALRYSDNQIARILEFLKANNLFNQSLIIITGDHGQSFYEHGTTCHANTLYNESITAGVVVKLPNGHSLVKAQSTIELLGIAPTVLDILEIPPHKAFQSKSFFSQELANHPIFSTVNSQIAKQDAVILNQWKLIRDYRNGQTLLFDLASDPGEKINMAHLHPQKAQELLNILLLWRNEQLKYYSSPIKHSKYYPPKYSIE